MPDVSLTFWTLNMIQRRSMLIRNVPVGRKPASLNRRPSAAVLTAALTGMFSAAMMLPLSAQARTAGDSVTSAFDLHKAGHFQSAAQRGLSDLLAQPWNHQLRFIVADSLQRTGRVSEAMAQLEALEGTPYAENASARIADLRAAISTVPAPVAHVAQVGGVGPVHIARPMYVSPGGTSISLEADPVPILQSPAPVAPQVPTPAPLLAPGSTAIPATPAASAAPSPPAQPAAATAPSPETRSAAAQRVAELAAAEKYQQVGTQGLALMAVETPDEELRLAIANSLSWTGRLDDAIQIYRGLAGGQYDSEAKIGMANAYRWRGRNDQAEPLYRSVLAASPDSLPAQQGLMLTQREVRPRTTVTFGTFSDSSDVQRRSGTINHKWQDGGGPDTIELETSIVRDRQAAVSATQPDLTVRYHAPTLALKPSFELGVATGNGGQSLHGSARLRFGENDDIVDIGRVNWARLATNPNALQANLSANHLGFQASRALDFGRVTGRLDYFDISDGNSILAGSLRLSSIWRPLGNAIKPFAGFEMRDAKFATANYWSPAAGYGSLYVGALAEWDDVNWNLYASGQAGMRVYGEAGNSWGVATGGKRWLSNDIGIGFSLWRMASQRNNAAYSASSMNVTLEKLW